jgi:hypothetical protein
MLLDFFTHEWRRLLRDNHTNSPHLRPPDGVLAII